MYYKYNSLENYLQAIRKVSAHLFNQIQHSLSLQTTLAEMATNSCFYFSLVSDDYFLRAFYLYFFVNYLHLFFQPPFHYCPYKPSSVPYVMKLLVFTLLLIM